MVEFWELCNTASRVVLGYLYKQEQGHWPDWDERSGRKVSRHPLVTMSPEVEAVHLEQVSRDMSRAPGNRGDGLDA